MIGSTRFHLPFLHAGGRTGFQIIIPLLRRQIPKGSHETFIFTHEDQQFDPTSPED